MKTTTQETCVCGVEGCVGGVVQKADEEGGTRGKELPPASFRKTSLGELMPRGEGAEKTLKGVKM